MQQKLNEIATIMGTLSKVERCSQMYLAAIYYDSNLSEDEFPLPFEENMDSVLSHADQTDQCSDEDHLLLHNYSENCCEDDPLSNNEAMGMLGVGKEGGVSFSGTDRDMHMLVKGFSKQGSRKLKKKKNQIRRQKELGDGS